MKKNCFIYWNLANYNYTEKRSYSLNFFLFCDNLFEIKQKYSLNKTVNLFLNDYEMILTNKFLTVRYLFF